MKKTAKRILAALMCASLLAVSIPIVSGVAIAADEITQADLDIKRNMLSDLQNQISDLQKQYDDLKNQGSFNESSIHAIEELIDRYIEEIKTLHELIVDNNKLVEATEKKAAEVSKEYAETYKTYLARLRSSREDGDYTTLEVLFNSKSFTEFILSAERVLDALSFDERIMNKLETKKNELEQELQKLNKFIEERNADIEKYEGLKSDLYQRINDLKTELEEIYKKELNTQALKDLLLDLQKETNDEFEKLQAEFDRQEELKQLELKSNRIVWPLDKSYHYISSYWGSRRDPITGLWDYHYGIDIPAPTGTQITAAKAGTVEKAVFSGSYGYHVIIFHGIDMESGKKMYTLYAHCSKLLVSEGQKVEQGQLIALVGETGRVTGAHLHLEVRLDGKDVNPLNYVTVPK